jgi:hypothetical protein
MFFTDILPKVFDVRIACVNERFPAMSVNEFETLIGISITGNEVIARTQFLSRPAI